MATATMPEQANASQAAGPKRKPRIGDWVYFWQPIGNNREHLNPAPAQIIHLVLGSAQTQPGAGEVHLNIHELGIMQMAMHITYSDKPQMGCWSYMPRE